nr:MAG TPA: hypothetical protein [Caudoviricetes sp.]
MDSYKKISKTYSSSDEYPNRFLHEMVVEDIMKKLKKHLNDTHKWITIKLMCDTNKCTQIVCTTNIGGVLLNGLFNHEGLFPDNLICKFPSNDLAQTFIDKFEALETHNIVGEYHA